MKISKIIILLLIIFSLVSCVVVKELVPRLPGESFQIDEIKPVDKSILAQDKDIGIENFYVKGFNELHTPPNVAPTKALKDFLMDTCGSTDLNRSNVIRVFNKKAKEAKPVRIFVFTPGIYSGAGTVINLAVSMEKRFADSEVWIWERRSNFLEDNRIILKALDEKNPKLLTDLLKPGEMKLKDKKTSFYQPSTEDISFMGYWGLNLMLKDLANVIIEARKKTNEIILVGYSLGTLYNTIFCANDFRDEIDSPGYKLVDKMILLDGPPMIDGYVPDEKTYKNGTTIIPYNVIEGIDKLESGKYYPACGTVDRDFTLFFMMDLQAALATLAPEELSNEPYNTGIKKLPITNLAKYLVQFDDNYNFFKLFTASFGRADARHIGIFSYSTTVSIAGLSPGKDRITWLPRKDGDRVEFNNYREYLKASVNKLYNMPDWYQPTRILLELGAIHHNDTTAGWQKKYFNLTENRKISMPFLCVGLARGLSTRAGIYLDYKKQISSNDFTVVMINNITHLDGDSIDDNGSRPVMADVIYNWLNNKEIADRDAKNYSKAYYSTK